MGADGPAGVATELPLVARLVLFRRRDDEAVESRSLMTMPLNQKPIGVT
jgi:hypothetical protein